MVDHVQYHLLRWQQGTAQLTWEATAVYRMICDHMYLHDGVVIWDEAKLARACKMQRRTFRKHTSVLFLEGKMWIDADGLLGVTRIKSEMKSIMDRSEKARTAVKVRWDKVREQRHQLAGASHSVDTDVSNFRPEDQYERMPDADTDVLQIKGKEMGRQSIPNNAAGPSLLQDEAHSSVPLATAAQPDGLHDGESAEELSEQDWIDRMGEPSDEPEPY